MDMIWVALVVFVTFVAVIGLASVGVMMGRKPIKGSCGGVGAVLGEKDYICPVCGDDPNKCEKEQEAEAAKAAAAEELGYELATKK
ncbi:(Na+)-NQR maturation NqrM [Motiliproteus sp.]|uniref:(Na+)-NQR maturation NqrM n=1 Tax=Motiliproteus sp. TaxID=1898955 RepID=UPI003BAC02FA